MYKSLMKMSTHKYRLTPAKVTLMYAAFAALWIGTSGKLLSYLVENPELQQQIELAKGFVFVAVTSGLLYLLLRLWHEPKINVHQIQHLHIKQPDQRGLLVVFISLTLVVPFAGLAINALYGPKIEHQAFDDLSSVAKLKTSQIEQWIKERYGDAYFIGYNRTITQDVHSLIRKKDPAAKYALLEKFDAFTRAYNYQNIILFNRVGGIELETHGHDQTEIGVLKAQVLQAMESGKIEMSGLYSDQQGEIHMDWITPIFPPDDTRNPIAAIVLRSSPKDFIIPLISVWPTSETSAETLLINSATGAIIFFDQSKKINHNQSLAKKPQLSVIFDQDMLKQSAQGRLRGIDHHGVEVLATFEPIKGLEWKLMTKINHEEVFKPLHGLAMWVSIIAFFSITALSAALLMIWRQRNQVFNLAALAEKNKSDALLTSFFELPFVGMAMVKPGENKWFNVNQEFCRILGYTREELLSKTWVDVSHPDDGYVSQPMMEGLLEGKAERYRAEKRYLHKDGHIVYVVLELRAIKNAEGRIEFLLGAISDITQYKLLYQKLAEREQRLNTLVHTIPDLVWLKDTHGVYLSCNRQFERLYGTTEENIVGKTDYDFVDKSLADFFRENDLKAAKSRKTSMNEEWLTFADTSETLLFETTKTPIFDEQGNLLGVLGIARDITERQHSNEKIMRLTQLYAWQGRCNKAIVECTTEEELFQKICKEAVEHGGLSLAWVAKVNHQTNFLENIASYGQGVKYLENIQISIDDNSPYGHGPTGTCIRDNAPFWCNDFLHNPVTKPWRDRASPYGWQASASLPLSKDNQVIGALTLYSELPNAFDQDTQELLLSITSDINFALRHIQVETEKRLAEAQLLKLSLAVEQSPNTIVITDLDANIEYANDAFTKITGYALDEVIGKNPNILQTGKTPSATYDEMWEKLLKGEVWKGELLNKRKDGSEYLEFAIISPVKQNDGKITHYLAIKEDITERKKAHSQLQLAAKVYEQGNEGIIITDERKRIIMVNRAFTEISGYSAEEVIGHDPKILSSGHQDIHFYRNMWDTIDSTGRWQGELWNRRKDGSTYPELLSITKVFDEATEQYQYIGIFTDITQSKVAEDRIKWLAHYDALTGLPNRELLNDRLSQNINSCARHGLSLALMFLDLDRFKNINDSLGHPIGDELLQVVSERLKNCLRNEDTVSRLGGDEFVVLLPNTDIRGASQVAEKIVSAISAPINLHDFELNVTPSIGIAMYPNDSMEAPELLQKADAAMYRTKHNGRNGYCFFTPDMQAAAAKTLQIDNALRRAIERQELMVYFQPQVDLSTGKLIGAEALIRWQHPEWGMVSPAEFIPIAEDSGQILQIGEWVLRNALRHLRSWMDDGVKPFRISVNLSVIQFRFKDLPMLVSNILDEEGVAPEYLELEITESASMEDPDAAILMTERLHKLGVELSIDDFGTGYSSLSYLKQLQVYKLKIDQSFVRDLTIDPEDKAIINAIISLATSLGMKTIAEGIETEAQRDYLNSALCKEGQGYLFGRPMNAADFRMFLSKNPPV